MRGERGEVERLRVVVVVLVRDDEHPGVAATPLHVLPRRAVLDAAAPVVSPAHPTKKIQFISRLAQHNDQINTATNIQNL